MTTKDATPEGVASSEGLGLAASAPKPRAWYCEYRSGEEFVSLAADPMNDPDVMAAWPLFAAEQLRAASAAERAKWESALELQQRSYEREIALEVAAERERWKQVASVALLAMELHAKMYPHMQKGYTVDAISELQTALGA